MKNLLFTKINLLCLTILISFSYLSNAQLTNGDFSNFCQTGNAFQINNCVDNWRNSHGTPTLTNGNASGWMWSYNGSGEGIVANFDFDPCNVYEITFRVRADDKNSGDPNVANTATINLEAANAVPQNNSTAFPTVNNSQVIFTDIMGPYLNTWTNITITFAPQNNYSQLWIYPFMQAPSNGVSQAEMNIDDIHIDIISQCCNDCEDFEPVPPSFTYTNILDPCFIEFNNFENAELSCPLTTPGFYIMDYGDGTIDGPNSTAHCDNHVYSCDGIYEACLTYYYTTPSGELCETAFCKKIEITGCSDCCEDCNVDTELLAVSVNGCFATVCNHTTFNEPCINPQYSWTVDGEPAIDTSPKDPTTFSYQFNCNSTYEICGTATVFNTATNLYCTDTDCEKVTIKDCRNCPCDIDPPIKLNVQPNGVLAWAPVPGAVSYIISSPGPYDLQIFCNTCKFPSYLEPISVSQPSYQLPPLMKNRCFVWRVQAVCADGTVSDVSKQLCYLGEIFVLDEELADDPKLEIGLEKLVDSDGISKVLVYPNPTTNQINIDLTADKEEHLTVQLIDQSGRILLENDGQIFKGYNQFTFNLTDLPRGIYMIKFNSEHINEYKKLMLIK